MKRFLKSTGVTLLEVMLVLVVAAMIIVMSIRYYQSAQTSQQVNTVLSQIQAITAAVDSVSQGQGTYAGVTNDKIAGLMPSATGLSTPWNTTIVVGGTTTPTTYTVSIPGTPVGVCQALIGKLSASTHFTALPTTCAAAGPFNYTYDSTANTPQK